MFYSGNPSIQQYITCSVIKLCMCPSTVPWIHIGDVEIKFHAQRSVHGFRVQKLQLCIKIPSIYNTADWADTKNWSGHDSKKKNPTLDKKETLTIQPVASLFTDYMAHIADTASLDKSAKKQAAASHLLK